MNIHPPDKVLSELLARSRLTPGRDLAELVTRAGRQMGLTCTAVYGGGPATGHAPGASPVPRPRGPGPRRGQLAGGFAYREERTQRSADGDTPWVPMIDGVGRLGVVKATGHGFDQGLIDRCEALAGVAALLQVSKSTHSDVLVEVERRGTMTVQVRLGSPTAAPIGSFAMAGTGGWQMWRTVPADISHPQALTTSI